MIWRYLTCVQKIMFKFCVFLFVFWRYYVIDPTSWRNNFSGTLNWYINPGGGLKATASFFGRAPLSTSLVHSFNSIPVADGKVQHQPSPRAEKWIQINLHPEFVIHRNKLMPLFLDRFESEHDDGSTHLFDHICVGMDGWNLDLWHE